MKNKIIHPGNFQCFLDIYKENLIKEVQNNPNEYAWSLDQLETVFSRMSSAIERGSFNKDSKAFKNTCKELKIKHTYKDIENFICLGGV